MSHFTIGQVLEPGMFPIIEEAYRIDTSVPSRWFVVQTEPRRESRAQDKISETGFSSYSPTRTFWGKRDKRTKRISRKSEPAFRGYLFVKMPEEGAFEQLRQCDGVSQVVTAGGSPATIPEEWVEQIRKRESEGAFDETRGRRGVRNDKSPFPEWVYPGALVKIVGGPFTSLMAQITEAVQAGRVKAETHLFGRSSPIELELAQIAKLC